MNWPTFIGAAMRSKLLIAKLDRLARSVSFISSLMDSDVEFAVSVALR